MDEHKISRSSFIKSIVAGGLAIAGIGNLAEASEKDSSMPSDGSIAPHKPEADDEAVKHTGSRGINNGYRIGQVMLAKGEIVLNEGRPTIEMIVTNSGDRPIQICSHYHFFEVNKVLKFDREKTFGMRLDIPAGSAIRFEPGEQKRVRLTTYAGAKKLYGFQGWTQGSIDDPKVKKAAMSKMRAALREG